eukprot:CAMPEP_0181200004 /NCGR_PEP_ID=MMETSP1096-20121128/17507_1 /TAXON_ID=156174 ORGANISM="Chrysochromulina ericina, Strain CCMP281" /NCGR_SAMPLE_ID=MMETSP1096 /ASSEMBLY_ACC=CAM_ASM_000453 /LENGTH=228 /DNA_ID=CAMNT_0023290281 /DNA_START=945 /DNA_END=1632 /DNA_ORIENTATION=-
MRQARVQRLVQQAAAVSSQHLHDARASPHFSRPYAAPDHDGFELQRSGVISAARRDSFLHHHPWGDLMQGPAFPLQAAGVRSPLAKVAATWAAFTTRGGRVYVPTIFDNVDIIRTGHMRRLCNVVAAPGECIFDTPESAREGALGHGAVRILGIIDLGNIDADFIHSSLVLHLIHVECKCGPSELLPDIKQIVPTHAGPNQVRDVKVGIELKQFGLRMHGSGQHQCEH